MKKHISMILLLAMLLTMFGCAAAEAPQAPAAEAPETPEASVTEAPEAPEADAPEEPQQDSTTSKVASADQMTTVEDVVEEGMVPVEAASLKDGVYSVTVDSSSSMFKITACELTVENGEMTAVMHMSGTSYLYLYMGTGEQAAAANEADYIAFDEQADGTHSFTVPVEALDKGVACAAYSKNKELWYDRTLLFRADSLPMDAFQDGYFTTVSSLALQDGSYTVELQLEGGSGKAKVESPAQLRVEDGTAYVTLVWGSSNYDYMKIGDTQYLPINTEGHSTFEIPVSAFDYKMPVLADTTAMSTPHEIEYTLYFDSATITAAQ